MHPDRSGLRVCVTAVASVVVGLSACAQQGAPPGGPEDRRPPVVVRTEPDTFAIVEDFDGPVRFVFDERISERVTGSLADLVTVSPRTGDVRVSHGRDDISVEIDGGFQPGRVYRITLQPAVSDLFNNQLRDPFELVFSTGGEVHPTAVAGFAWDRLNGSGMDDARVEMRAMDDSTVPHVARADTGGLYAIRYVPPGRYFLTAWVDRNRDGEPSGDEPRGRINFVLAATDTLLADLPLLAPDTTPARITGVEVIDSMTIVVRFDDHLDPSDPVRTIGVGLQPDSSASDSTQVPGTDRVYHVWEYNRWAGEVADSFARLDSLEAAEEAAIREAVARAAAERAEAGAPDPVEAESLAADPAVADSTDPDSIRATGAQAAPPARRIPPRVTPTTPSRVGPDAPPPVPVPGSPSRIGPFPEQRVVVTLDGALPVNEPVRVLVTGVRNIAGLSLGGGQAVFVREPPPAPDTTAAEAAGDTLAADTIPPDGVVGDTLAADTIPPGVPVGDTIATDTIPPDTLPGRFRGAASAASFVLPGRAPRLRRR